MLPLLVLVPQLHISLQGHSSSCECQNKFDQILAPRHCNSQPKVQRDVQTSWHLPWKKKGTVWRLPRSLIQYTDQWIGKWIPCQDASEHKNIKWFSKEYQWMQILSSVTRRGLHPNVHQAQRGTNEAIYRSHLDEPKIQLNFEFPQSDLADLCLPQNISQQISKTSKRGLHLFSKDHKHIYIPYIYIHVYIFWYNIYI